MAGDLQPHTQAPELASRIAGWDLMTCDVMTLCNQQQQGERLDELAACIRMWHSQLQGFPTGADASMPDPQPRGS